MGDLRLQEYVAKIRRLIRDNRQDEAMAHCLHILRLYPKHIQTYYLLGEACLAGDSYQAARRLFQRALSADPEHLDAWLGLASAYEQEGKVAEALWSAERTFDLVPGDARARQKLQRLSASKGEDHHAGSEVYCPMLARGALARLYVRCGLHDRAVGEFLAVLRRDPDLPDIRVGLAEALWHQKRYLEADEACTKLLEDLPNCLKANLILGTIRLRSGERGEGEARMSTARALDPENLMAQRMLGVESPLPPREVLIAEWEARAQTSPRVEARMETQAHAQEIPEWVRELELELTE